jgi:hypothetical protein
MSRGSGALVMNALLCSLPGERFTLSSCLSDWSLFNYVAQYMTSSVMLPPARLVCVTYVICSAYSARPLCVGWQR